MPVVVDASAVAAIMFDEPEAAEVAAALADETLLAPALLDAELTSVAVKKARRQPHRAAEIAVCLQAALHLPVSRIAVPGGAVFLLARETGLTAYDASYLWLARSRDCGLVTLDVRLARLSPT
jgi:predicted nucleic acid-binding protein